VICIIFILNKVFEMMIVIKENERQKKNYLNYKKYIMLIKITSLINNEVGLEEVTLALFSSFVTLV
jgi:hypothetical protein